MVTAFVAFSSWRMVVASSVAASSSATACVNSVILSVSFAIEASNESISELRVATFSVFSLRVCSFCVNSVSHHPLCSASSFASSINLMIKSLIIFFTLTKGSSATREAKANSRRLLRRFAWACRYCATRICVFVAEDARSCASTGPCFFCKRLGRYLSALPATAALLMISMAFVIVTISSARNFWRDAKDDAFSEQVAVKSARYASSAFLTDVVSALSPSSMAFCSRVLVL
mmetsp:Transcript_71799/g.118916  ORF Transcript_71799/g.118916 Transcript_71799/m.118916 type:complete len:232 (-) Transcript_71799:853-1548(-)